MTRTGELASISNDLRMTLNPQSSLQSPLSAALFAIAEQMSRSNDLDEKCAADAAAREDYMVEAYAATEPGHKLSEAIAKLHEIHERANEWLSLRGDEGRAEHVLETYAMIKKLIEFLKDHEQ